MTKRSLGSRPEVWGCIGTVAAAIIAGVFSVIVALINDVNFGALVDRTLGNEDMGQAVTPGQPTPAATLWQFPTAEIPTPFSTQGASMPSGGTPANVATPNLDDIAPGLFMPAASSCPPDSRAVNLNLPGQWYGPFGFNLNNFIMYDAWYFYTWDSAQYNIFTGAYGVSAQIPRVPNEPINQWLQLPNSYFWVCIDSSANLYTVYSGN
jgi:hypothetical protein